MSPVLLASLNDFPGLSGVCAVTGAEAEPLFPLIIALTFIVFVQFFGLFYPLLVLGYYRANHLIKSKLKKTSDEY